MQPQVSRLPARRPFAYPTGRALGLNDSVPGTSVTLVKDECACRYCNSRFTSPTPFEPASGAISTVLRMPSALPLASRKALPESPGMPGVTVYTECVHPAPLSPRLMPCFGLSCDTPRRSSELPYE